jgi:putative Mg2+ transporter-C (MgtC) family protein
MLVALGSVVTMLIALELFEEMSTLGFLCAGVIFVAQGSVYGLTTAASLWMTGSLGMAAGAGMYQIAVAGVMFAVLPLTRVWLLTRRMPGSSSRKDDI